MAICTWNRARFLADTLSVLSEVEAPPELRWELIVVDNASTDRTPEAIMEWAGRLPIRMVREARQGLSHARNAALAAARGRYIIWTDDDVHVARNWLVAYADAFRRHPEAGFFGGPVRPMFEGSPPPWLARGFESISGAYAVRDFGSAEIPLDGDHLPFGANMAFRLDLARRHPYDPTLGRRGPTMLHGEESQVMEAVLAEGTAGWWVPEAAVDHLIPRERQTLGYLRRYFRGVGATLSRMHGLPAGRARFLGAPAWLWLSTARGGVGLVLGVATRDSRRWLPHYRQWFTGCAYLRGCFRLWAAGSWRRGKVAC